MLCSDCNNKCEHCYINYNGLFKDERLNELVPILLKKYKVLFNGAEPIIHKEYLKYYKMANNDIIMTNGIALKNNNELMNILIENEVKEIAISYHYGIQDDISLIKIRELDLIIKNLKDKGFKVKLMCSLSVDNYLLVEEACLNAINIGADKIRFTNYIMQGNAINNCCDKILNKKQINYVLNEILRLRQKISKEILYIERCGSFGKNELFEDHFKCIGMNNMVAITPDEKVYGCIFDTSKGNEIGYIDSSNRIMIDDNNKFDKGFCKILKKYNNISN